MNRRKLLIRSVLLAAVAVVIAASLTVPRPAHADPNLGFVQQYQPDNPDGSWNVGSTVHLIAEPSSCNSVQVDWGDSYVQTGSGSYIYFDHAYGSPGTYTVKATELCSGGGTGYLTITIAGGFGGLDLQTLAGVMGLLFGLLGIGLAVSGPSLKVAAAAPPPGPPDGSPTVDLDKKVGLLKTDAEVKDQMGFFDQQRKGWEYDKPKAYVDRVSEVIYRTRDDPWARFLNPELVFVASAANAIDPDVPKAVYDPETNRYYYDFQQTEDQDEAVKDMLKSGFEIVGPKAKFELGEMLKGFEYSKGPLAEPELPVRAEEDSPYGAVGRLHAGAMTWMPMT